LVSWTTTGIGAQSNLARGARIFLPEIMYEKKLAKYPNCT